MKPKLPLFIKNFLRCGLTGWCMEIFFTSLDSLRRRDYKLKGNTSISHLWLRRTVFPHSQTSPPQALLG